MSQKNKKKKGKAESSNKTRILLRLQKFEAFSPDTAKSLKELGLTDTKKFEKHLESLEAKGKIKREGKGESTKIWANKDKIKPKKSSNTNNSFMLGIGLTFIILFLVFVIFQPK